MCITLSISTRAKLLPFQVPAWLQALLPFAFSFLDYVTKAPLTPEDFFPFDPWAEQRKLLGDSPIHSSMCEGEYHFCLNEAANQLHP